MRKDICNSKKFYDTEFEATVMAAKTSVFFGTEMIPYPCGRHWHIGNKNKAMRGKNRQYQKTYCEYCGVYMRPGQYHKHTQKPQHQAKVREASGGNDGNHPSSSL